MSAVPASWPSGVDDVTLVEGEWFIAQTKPQEEKRFAHDLAHLGIDYYLPLVSRKSRAGGKLHTVWQPLMQGYVFFSGTRQEVDNPLEGGRMKVCPERQKAIRTARLSQVIDVHPADRTKFVGQLAAIQKAVNWNPFLGEENVIGPGRRCLVLRGHYLEGYEAICHHVVDESSRRVIWLRLDLLGQEKPFPIDEEYIRLLD